MIGPLGGWQPAVLVLHLTLGRVVGVVEDARHGGVDLSPWGKFDRSVMAVYSLLFHMLDVAAIAGEVWDRVLTERQRRVIADGLEVTLGEARALVAFFAGLHDLGKLSRFQECEAHPWARVSEVLRADTCGWVRMPHTRASMHCVLGLLAELGYRDATNSSPAVRVAQIVGAHHGRYLQVDVHGAASAARVQADLGGARWQDLRRRYLLLVRHLTGANAVPVRVSVPAAVLMTGVGVLADRLASQRHYWLPKAQAPAFGAAEHYQGAVKDAREVVDRSGLARVTLPLTPFTQAHPRLGAPNALQASLMEQLPPMVSQKGPGIVVVTDATGGGKSVAALEAARIFNTYCGTAGVAWLLPTTATTDAAYDTLEAYVAAHRPERAPVTLVHNHSGQNSAYTDPQPAADQTEACDDCEQDTEPGEGEVNAEQRATAPEGWLRSWDRALLAQFTAATHDQALMAVLPVHFNFLRMLALSGKTVIIDEAHAVTTFTQQLLNRLLHWLGAFGCPVVVLSATLPASASGELVRSYLNGAGHSRHVLADRLLAPPYPGWLFAAASDAATTVITPQAQTEHAAKQRRAATIHLARVQRASDDTALPGTADERLACIAEKIVPVAARGGCAAVECATVADAQSTYQYLRRTLTWPDGPGDLVLLHARLPGYRREAITRAVRAALGPVGPRPDRMVVVTTSLLDMSLDVDVDIMVSDLASLARLLQRLGRLWRFQKLWGPDENRRRRPRWMQDMKGPRMTVLHPVDEHGRTVIPVSWRTLEPAFLTHSTAALLSEPAERSLTLPDQVQDLIEQVHGEVPHIAADPTSDLHRRHIVYLGKSRAEEHLSTSHLIPPHARVSSLADLHRQYLPPKNAATRLGAMPERLLPCYRTPNGTLTLDPEGTRPLPVDTEPNTAMVRAILQHTVPIPAAWIAERTPEHRAPNTWHSHPRLSDLVLCPHDPVQPGQAIRFGRHTLRLDAELGLVHKKV